MRLEIIACTLGSMFAAASFVGCAGDDEIAGKLPGIDTGTLQQSWSIEGSTDVAKCQQYRADRMRIVVLDPKGSVHATEFAPCNDFQKTLELQTDTYTGNATFVDGAGYPVSKTLPIPQFTIAADRTVTMSLDFTSADMASP